MMIDAARRLLRSTRSGCKQNSNPCDSIGDFAESQAAGALGKEGVGAAGGEFWVVASMAVAGEDAPHAGHHGLRHLMGLDVEPDPEAWVRVTALPVGGPSDAGLVAGPEDHRGVSSGRDRGTGRALHDPGLRGEVLSLATAGRGERSRPGSDPGPRPRPRCSRRPAAQARAGQANVRWTRSATNNSPSRRWRRRRSQNVRQAPKSKPRARGLVAARRSPRLEAGVPASRLVKRPGRTERKPEGASAPARGT